jgi:excisionase family DNA binding protein
MLTLAEACAIARVGRSSIYGAIRRGELRAVKIGRRTLIRASDLYEWLDSAPALRPRARAPAAQMRARLRAKVGEPP